jgi:hypothetical protein
VTERFTGHLAQDGSLLAGKLFFPENLGIHLRGVVLGPSSPTSGLLVWIDGLAATERIQTGILGPLEAYRGTPAQASVAACLPIAGQQTVADPNEALRLLLQGQTALLADGWDSALLLDTAALPNHPSRLVYQANRDEFSADLRLNIALLRKRLQDPNLLAQRVQLKHRERGEVVILHIKGKALPALVRRVRLWACKHAGEGMAGRGLMGSTHGAFGGIPRFDASPWPDDMATLLDNGYVVLLVDRIARAFAVPVTAPFWALSAGDLGVLYPLRRWLILMRVLLYLIVLFLPGAVIALTNYHVDMVPTAFLTAVSSVRENAPLGLVFEMVLMEILIEVGREVSFRLPVGVTPGTTLVVLVLITLLTVLSGFVGPVAGMAAVTGALCSLALPAYAGTYLVRVWRFYMLAAASILGFFGMAAVFAVLTAYLCRVRSWGIPFLGPAGTRFTAPEGRSNLPPHRKGGTGFGKHPTDLR